MKMLNLKLLISIALLLGFMGSSLAEIKSPAWVLKNDFQSSKVWQHKKDSNLYVAIEKNKLEDKKNYLKALEGTQDKAKSSILDLIGVKNWKRTSGKWVTLSKRKFYQIEGTYTDNNDDTVYFREYHYILKDKVLKSVFTSVNKKSYSKEKDIKVFLKQVSMGDVVE